MKRSQIDPPQKDLLSKSPALLGPKSSQCVFNESSVRFVVIYEEI